MQTTQLARIARLTPLPVILVAPFSASAYFRTADGAESLDASWVASWSGWFVDALPGAFSWAAPQTVYVTYGKVAVLAFVGILCALVALRRADVSASRLSRWAPRCGLVAFGLALLGMVGEYWTPWTDQSFMLLSVPAVLLVLLTSPLLGIWLLRRRLGSRLGGWMVALTAPGLIGSAALGGHLGMALVWLSVAWALNAHGLLAHRGPASPQPLSALGNRVSKSSTATRRRWRHRASGGP